MTAVRGRMKTEQGRVILYNHFILYNSLHQNVSSFSQDVYIFFLAPEALNNY